MTFSTGDIVMVRPSVGYGTVSNPDTGGTLTGSTQVTWSPYWAAMLQQGFILATLVSAGSGNSGGNPGSGSNGGGGTQLGSGVTLSQVDTEIAAALVAAGVPNGSTVPSLISAAIAAQGTGQGVSAAQSLVNSLIFG